MIIRRDRSRIPGDYRFRETETEMGRWRLQSSQKGIFWRHRRVKTMIENRKGRKGSPLDSSKRWVSSCACWGLSDWESLIGSRWLPNISCHCMNSIKKHWNFKISDSWSSEAKRETEEVLDVSETSRPRDAKLFVGFDLLDGRLERDSMFLNQMTSEEA